MVGNIIRDLVCADKSAQMALDCGDGKPVFGKIIFKVECFKQKADQLFCRSRLAQ